MAESDAETMAAARRLEAALERIAAARRGAEPSSDAPMRRPQDAVVAQIATRLDALIAQLRGVLTEAEAGGRTDETPQADRP
jgi:hypothetical protein